MRRFALCAALTATTLATAQENLDAAKAAAKPVSAPTTFGERFAVEKVLFREPLSYPYGLAVGPINGTKWKPAGGGGTNSIIFVDGAYPPIRATSDVWFLENDGTGVFSRGKVPTDFYTDRLHRLFGSHMAAVFERAILVPRAGADAPDLIVAQVHEYIYWGKAADETLQQGIYLFENPGRRANEKPVNAGNSFPWKKRPIATALHPYALAVGRFSGQGEYDLAVGCTRGSGTDDEGLLWFERTERGLWAKHPIDLDLHNVRTVEAADINGDGRVDIVAASLHEDTLAWYENPKTPEERAKPWKKHLISTGVKFHCPSHGHVVPVKTKDGVRYDLLMPFGSEGEPRKVATNQLVWLENQNNGSGWKAHPIGKVENGFEARPICLAKGGFPAGGRKGGFEEPGRGEYPDILTRGIDDPGLAFVCTSYGDIGDPTKGKITLFVRQPAKGGGQWAPLVCDNLAGDQPVGRFNSVSVGDLNGDGFDDFVVAREGAARALYVFLQKPKK